MYFLLVLMGIAALVGALTLISEKLEIGGQTYAEGRHARIVGGLLVLPIAYTFLIIALYGLVELVTDVTVSTEAAATMNVLQHVVTFGSIIAAAAYALIHRGEKEYFA